MLIGGFPSTRSQICSAVEPKIEIAPNVHIGIEAIIMMALTIFGTLLRKFKPINIG